MSREKEITEEEIKSLTIEETINGVVCRGFAVVFLLEDVTLIKAEEAAVYTYLTKSAFEDASEKFAQQIQKGGEVTRQEFEAIHPIVIHCPKSEEDLKSLLHPFVRGTSYLNSNILSSFVMLAQREKVLPLKAFDMKEDILASVGVENQIPEEQL
jgi:hypothetical protein